MKNKKETSMEQMVDKLLKDQKIETTSIDFSARLMTRIEALPKHQPMRYKPLISKRFWWLAAILSGLLIGGWALTQTPETTNWISAIDFSVLSNNPISNSLSQFAIPKTVLYGVALFGMMFFVQIPLMKSYFDGRLNSST